MKDSMNLAHPHASKFKKGALMKLASTAALIASLLTASLAATASAQGLLDQQLGTTPAPAAKPDSAKPDAAKTNAPKTDAAKSDDQKPATPAGTTPNPITLNANDITSPDAVKRVDDADLINKLTKTDDAKANANEVAVKMKDMLDRMGQSENRLTQKDAGEDTQETQRRILTDLDVLIEYARQQMQSGQSQNQQQQPGQGRQYTQGNGKSQGGSTPAGSSFLPQNNQDPARPGEDIRSKGSQEWGTLRPRERDLISHGANEEYLSSYKDMIERYYQALAELGKKK
jgi:hypothetical protein